MCEKDEHLQKLTQLYLIASDSRQRLLDAKLRRTILSTALTNAQSSWREYCSNCSNCSWQRKGRSEKQTNERLKLIRSNNSWQPSKYLSLQLTNALRKCCFNSRNLRVSTMGRIKSRTDGLFQNTMTAYRIDDWLPVRIWTRKNGQQHLNDAPLTGGPTDKNEKHVSRESFQFRHDYRTSAEFVSTHWTYCSLQGLYKNILQLG